MDRLIAGNGQPVFNLNMAWGAFMRKPHPMLLQKMLKLLFAERRPYNSDDNTQVPVTEEIEHLLSNDVAHADIKLAISGNFRINFRE